MAFSTQKDFFHVPFMNETSQLGCKKACVKLKSYESTIDDRSWASDETKQSKFLSDLVTCQYPTGLGNGTGDYSVSDDQVEHDGYKNSAGTVRGPNNGVLKERARSERKHLQGDAAQTKVPENHIMPQLGDLTAGDSLIECANIHLAEYQKILKIKSSLEKQLEVSNERLKTAKEENKKIREILDNKLDSNTAKDFYNKIQKLTTAGKFSKNEENEMLQIYQKMENMHKANEILQAENNYLKRLIEKLSKRVALDNISTQPEQSNDVVYLQKEVNSLRKECIMLRQMEDDFQRLKQQQQNANKLPSITEQDAENIKAIIKERNSLREKCISFKALKQQVHELEQKAQEANEKANDLTTNLSNQSQYIDKMEGEMQNMQKYYEDQNQSACFREECLKAQLEDLRHDLIKAKCQAQKADMLHMEVSSLRNELLQRDLVINDYDCQYKQLMDVINELQAVKLQCLHDNQTQTNKNQTDELAFYTCATLDEIMKELKRKGCLNDEFMTAYGLQPAPNDRSAVHDKQCCLEKERLQQQVEEMKKEMKESANCEALCADALKRLQEFEKENAELLQKNQGLNEKLKDGENKMAVMLNKIEHLDKEINRNGQEAQQIGRDLEGTIDLVKNISDVQLENQHLSNAVSAINSRDDQKIIDDLRRQLEEELAKLKKCQLDNVRLQEESKAREIDLKDLKERNNKLEADRKKLNAENNKPNNKKANLKYPEGKRGNNDLRDNDDGSEEEGPDTEIASKRDKHKSGKYLDSDEDKLETSNYKTKDRIEKYLDTDEVAKGESKTSTNKTGKSLLDTDKTTDRSKTLSNTEQDNAKQPLKDSAKTTSDKRKKYTKDSSENKKQPLTDGINRPKPNIKAAALDDYSSEQAVASPRKDVDSKHIKHMGHFKAAALDDFVNKKTDNFKCNLQQGRSFEKEFRNILEDFIHECGYCFCRLFNSKSKLYAICHKLYHSGIETLSFRELAYLHKKIYVQAEQLLPGCLLDMILSDHKEQIAKNMSKSVVMSRLVGGNDIKSKMSETTITDLDQKCCSCKNELCCNNSEEMLKDKVNKLEKDIEIAREYLETLKNIPLESSLTSDNGDSTDTNNSTYRASSNTMIPQKSYSSKHLKRIKARLMKSKQLQ